jgi:hypothetical protein
MPSFSEKKGLKPVRMGMQIKSMDDALRNGLWNMFDLCDWDQIRNSQVQDETLRYFDELRNLRQRVWLFYFKAPLDVQPRFWTDIRGSLREYFFRCAWNEVYDFIEFVVANYEEEYRNEQFTVACNHALLREMAAYRFVSGRITEVTAEEEMKK